MNFLAHSYLSCSDENLLVGNILADFASNKEIAGIPKKFHKGIELHRKIDSYTDTHPVVLKINKLFHPKHGKYAPVVTDVLFDYILAKEWSNYSGQYLRTFIDTVYEILQRNFVHFPERRRKSIINMVNGDFLYKYTTEEGLIFTFTMMEKRTKFRSNFIAAVETLPNVLQIMTNGFNQFFPELISETDQYCAC